MKLKRFSEIKILLIVGVIAVAVFSLWIKISCLGDKTGSLNSNNIFYSMDLLFFLGFSSWRFYKDWGIKKEMYVMNKRLEELNMSNIVEQYDNLNEEFSDKEKFKETSSDWDSFAESVFIEEGICYQTVDAEAFFNQSTLLKERMNKKFLDYAPQALLGIGIFGTFFGLATGLSSIDLVHGDVGQLNALILGTKVSFYTSLYGMYFSIALSFIINIHIGDYEANIQKIKNNLNRIFKQALAEQSLIRIEKEIVKVRETNTRISDTIGEELVKAIDQYNEMNKVKMTELTTLVAVNIDGLATKVTDLFSEKLESIFSEEFISKFDSLTNKILNITEKNNQNILHYKNSMKGISQSISSVNKKLEQFAEGTLQHFTDIVDKYDHRIPEIFEIVDKTKSNYTEFMGLLDESSEVIKISNSYIRNTENVTNLLNQFLLEEQSLIKFWNENRDIVSSLNEKLDEFSTKYEKKLLDFEANFEENLDITQQQTQNIFKSYDSNLTTVVTEFHKMLLNLKEILETSNYQLKESNISITEFKEQFKDIQTFKTQIINTIEKLEEKKLEDTTRKEETVKVKDNNRRKN